MTTAHPLRVAVLGAGAVGCYYDGMLARAGVAVTLIGRATHVEAIRRDGLVIEWADRRETIRVDATTDVAAVRDAGVVLVPKENWEGAVGLVRIIKTECGEYALHARSEDGWVTSTNVEFNFMKRNEIARRTILGAHATQHEEGGGDEINILDLAFPGGTTYLRADGTWSNPATGSAITTLNTLTASTQTMTNSNDTNVTLAITQISTSEHRFTMGWTSQLSVGRGGTGASTLTGLLQGNGTSAITGITNSSIHSLV